MPGDAIVKRDRSPLLSRYLLREVSIAYPFGSRQCMGNFAELIHCYIVAVHWAPGMQLLYGLDAMSVTNANTAQVRRNRCKHGNAVAEDGFPWKK